ncbi:MAG: Two-component system response regulator [Solirubrobacteraceae bacterium]|nr:Two-component system response regulator [Solirubrobacteraceae bacterium]
MRILLVEDLSSDAVLLREALRDAGLDDDLVLAHDGREALDLLHSGKPLPQLVLLDLNLPKVSGREVLDEIRSDARLKELPVVVLTMSLSPADVSFAYRHLANAYVRKPNGFEALSTVARAIRDFWTRAATLPSAYPVA